MIRKLIILSLIIGLLIPSGVFAQSSNPQSGSIKVEGTIEGAAPQTAPTIAIPTDGQEIEDVPIDVSGLCTPGLLVRLFRNDIFTGSAICTDAGTWEITTDLAFGTNELVAYQYDDLDQQSPASNTVTVEYEPDDVDQDFKRPFITTDFAKLGSDPQTEFTWPFVLTGVEGPYALFIDWGDGSTELKSLAATGSFDLNHTYENA